MLDCLLYHDSTCFTLLQRPNITNNKINRRIVVKCNLHELQHSLLFHRNLLCYRGPEDPSLVDIHSLPVLLTSLEETNGRRKYDCPMYNLHGNICYEQTNRAVTKSLQSLRAKLLEP